MYQTFLFDLDGTLIDSLADITASVNVVRAHHGLEALSAEHVRGAVGDGLLQLLNRTLPEGSDVDAARAVYWDHHREHLLDHTRLYPGVREGLEELRGKAAVGVVTNKPQAFSQQILAGLGIAHLVDVVVGGDSPAGRKPDPAPVRAALEQVSAPPWSALMVGDSAGDLRAGRAAGTATCAVAWGFRELATLHPLGPDHEVWRFEEVVGLAAWRDHRALSLYGLLGEETFWRLARAFYGQVDRDPRLRAMFPRDLTAPIEHQARFLAQFFGGPSEYSRQRGHPRLRMRHAPFPITRAASEAWLENMLTAMTEVGIPEPAAGVMRRYFAHTAAFLVNREG